MNEHLENAKNHLLVLKNTFEEFGHPYLSRLVKYIGEIEGLIEESKIDLAIAKAHVLLSLLSKADIVSMAAKVDETINFLVRAEAFQVKEGLQS